MKYYYKIYGLKVESDIKIPELVVLKESERENLQVKIIIGEVPKSIKEAKERGLREGFKKQEMWFHVAGIGTYYIKDGNIILVEPNTDIHNQYIKTFVLGSGFGLLLNQRNIVAIHGGTVVVDGKAIICTGDTGAGKSTLTSALRLEGYSFLADDVSAIEVNKDIKVFPAYPQQKLCGDAVIKLGHDTKNYIRIDEGRDKYAIPSNDKFINKPVQLHAIFKLEKAQVDSVHIEKLKGTDKMNVIMDNVYRGYVNNIAGLDREYFKKCLQLAKSVEVFKIKRPVEGFTVKEQIKMIKSVI